MDAKKIMNSLAPPTLHAVLQTINLLDETYGQHFIQFDTDNESFIPLKAATVVSRIYGKELYVTSFRRGIVDSCKILGSRIYLRDRDKNLGRLYIGARVQADSSHKGKIIILESARELAIQYDSGYIAMLTPDNASELELIEQTDNKT